MGRIPFLVAILLGGLSAGCQSATRIGQEIHAGTRPGAYIPDVPSERQATPGSCGANALASVLRHWKIPATQKELDAALYIPSIKGTLTVDLWRAARARGLWTWEKDTLSEQDLLDLVTWRIPPLVLTKRRSGNRLLDHYLVLTGFDAEKDRWIAQAGLGTEEMIARETFAAGWLAAGRWTLVAAPPDGEAGWLAWRLADRTEWRCRNNLAEARVGQKRLDEAERFLAEALTAAPPEGENPAAWACLKDTQGTLLSAKGDAEGALALFCEALRLARLAGLPESVVREIRARRDAALTPPLQNE